jgi:hypothetical protein
MSITGVSPVRVVVFVVVVPKKKQQIMGKTPMGLMARMAMLRVQTERPMR